MRFQNSRLIFFVIVCTHFTAISGIFNVEEFDRRLNALWKVVNYMAQRAENMNLDGMFGLTQAEAHILATLSHSNVHFIQLDYQNILADLLKICSNARKSMKEALKPKDKTSGIFKDTLTYPEPWIYPILWKNGLLKHSVLRKFNNSDKIYRQVLNNGTPEEEESDYCLGSMLKGYPKETCKLPEECELMLLRDDNPQGYPLTHRLLIIWIAKVFHCEEIELTSYAELFPKYCSAILQNLVDIESLGFPPPGTDLACEEVVLCGSEGYLEFANDYYANLIMSWQQPIGCFDSMNKKNENSSRTRRETRITDKNCESHATGLGAASLALLLRQYVETSTYI